jgi:hypothetical protein
MTLRAFKAALPLCFCAMLPLQARANMNGANFDFLIYFFYGAIAMFVLNTLLCTFNLFIRSKVMVVICIILLIPLLLLSLYIWSWSGYLDGVAVYANGGILACIVQIIMIIVAIRKIRARMKMINAGK